MGRQRYTLADLMARLSERLGPNETFWPARQERKDALNEAISVWQALTGEWTTQIAISGKSKNRNFYPTPRQIVSITRITTAAGTDSTAETLINEIDPILAMEFRLVGAEGWEQGLYDSLLTNLYSYWSLDEPNGIRYKTLGSASSGTDLAETYVPVTTTAGKFGLAAESIPAGYTSSPVLTSGTLNPTLSTSGGLTIACWFKNQTLYYGAKTECLFNLKGTTSGIGFFRSADTGWVPAGFEGDVHFMWVIDNVPGYNFTSPIGLGPFTRDVWHLVVIWVNADGTFGVQVDGSTRSGDVASASYVAPIGYATGSFTAGNYPRNLNTFQLFNVLALPVPTDWDYWHGSADSPMIWTRALSAGERTQLWSGGKKPYWEAYTVPGATVVWNSIPSGGQEPYSYSWSIAPDDLGLTPFTSTEVAPYQLIPSYGGDWTATLVTTDAAGDSYTATFPFVVDVPPVADPPSIGSVTQGCATPLTFLWNVTNVSISDGSGNYTYAWRLYENGDEITGDLVGTSSAALPSIDFSGAPAMGVICSGRFYLDLYDVTLGVHAYFDGLVDCNCT